MDTPTPVIVAHELSKKYDSLQVLNKLSLEVLKGETLVILGRSGVGKSVLLKQILGLGRPDHGYVEVEGQKISGLAPSKRYSRTKNVGMLFQGGALFDSMTVGENVAFYLDQHGSLSKKEIKERVAEALTMVGLKGTEGKMPSNLSGGMKRRAALARLIIYHPRIMLYDEPTAGLDPITAMQINKLILKTQKQLQSTSIVVTHDIRSAAEIGDRLAFITEGNIRHIAPKKEFFQIDDPTLQEFFADAIFEKKKA